MKNWIYSEANKEDIVICSKLSLSRNYEKFLFTDKMSQEDTRNNVDDICSTILQKMNESNMQLIKLWECEYKTIKAYEERQVISNELVKRRDRAAVAVNSDETISVMINEEDHIKIQCISSGIELQELYDEANKIDDILEEFSAYAFHEEYGYLTAKPENVGTGMKVSVMIHLPALKTSGEIPNILKGLNQFGMTLNEKYVDRNESNSNIYEISNKITIGLSEEELLANLKAVVLNIVSEEKKAREILLSKYKPEVEDRVFRACGILLNARILSEKEVLELVSNMRLGVELSLLDVSKRSLNRILIETRNSIIEDNSDINLGTREKNILRANLVEQILNE